MTEADRRAADVAAALLDAARRAGADMADAVAFSGETLSVDARRGALEHIERDEFLDFGLRVMLADGAGGARSASVSASDPSAEAIARLVETAMAMAREAPSDPYAGLAEGWLSHHETAARIAATPLVEDRPAPSPDALLEDALALEAAAGAVAGVSQVEGASASWRRSWSQLATSAGFSGGYASSWHSRSASAVAGAVGEDGGMERDYGFSVARRRGDVRALEDIGREAGERAVRRRKPRAAKSGLFPVIFEPRVASSLVNALLSAANGASVARGSSFLAEKMGERLLPERFDLIDDPTEARGLGAMPFDGEGVGGRRKKIIEAGVLSAWLLDSASAKQLGLATNGSAQRGTAGGPRPGASTAWLTPGDKSPQALIAEVQDGLFVTEMMGGGVNPVTGEYSRGAAGFWIEKGELAYPVSELTVAGVFLDMLARLEAADDLVFDRRVIAPSLRVDGLTIAANG